jgi:hypothetical protein
MTDIGNILNQRKKDIALARVRSRIAGSCRNSGLETLRRARGYTVLSKLKNMKESQIIKKPIGTIEP